MLNTDLGKVGLPKTPCLTSRKMCMMLLLQMIFFLTKAFDTVKHEILLGKIYRYGIRETCLEWKRSYLRDRKQCVVVGDVSSQYSVNNIGIPQGSILGPLFFIIYINDMPNISNNISCIMFADDTTLLFKNPGLV